MGNKSVSSHFIHFIFYHGLHNGDDALLHVEGDTVAADVVAVDFSVLPSPLEGLQNPDSLQNSAGPQTRLDVTAGEPLVSHRRVYDFEGHEIAAVVVDADFPVLPSPSEGLQNPDVDFDCGAAIAVAGDIQACNVVDSEQLGFVRSVSGMSQIFQRAALFESSLRAQGSGAEVMSMWTSMAQCIREFPLLDVWLARAVRWEDRRFLAAAFVVQSLPVSANLGAVASKLSQAISDDWSEEKLKEYFVDREIFLDDSWRVLADMPGG